MKDTQHTPGPWRITNKSSFGDPAGICSIDGLHITGVCGYGMLDAQNDANASLIAAAPDMLSALKKAELILRTSTHPLGKLTLEHVRAAIARATGNP